MINYLPHRQIWNVVKIKIYSIYTQHIPCNLNMKIVIVRYKFKNKKNTKILSTEEHNEILIYLKKLL